MLEYDILGVFVWGLQIVHDDTNLGVADKITSGLSRLAALSVPCVALWAGTFPSRVLGK